MAEITIPPPCADGYWHFTYITTDSLDGRWYGGKRSTKKHPLSDRYIGSGNWVKKHPARERLKREIVAFYAGSAEVYAAEAELVTWDKVFDDPLCMNLRDGGEGVTAEAAVLRYSDPEQRANNRAMLRRIQADPKVRLKMSTSARLRYENPAELAKQILHMRRITSDPDIINKAAISRDTPEWRENVTAANRRKAADPKWRATISAIMLRKGADPEWKEARAVANRRMALDPEWRAAHAAGMEKRSKDPKWIESMRRMHADRRAAKASEST